jgi:cell division protein FtsB
MRRVARRRTKKSLIENPIVLVLIGLIVLAIVASSVSSFLRSRKFKLQLMGTRNEIAEYESKLEELESRIEKLQSDEGVELEARVRLNLQRPGEHVLVIVDDEENTGEVVDNNSSWWAWVTGWFR